MDKLDKLIKKARESNIMLPYMDYDYAKLTTEELYELISNDITDKRIYEILEPARFTSTNANGIRKKLGRLSYEELEEKAVSYERINMGGAQWTE